MRTPVLRSSCRVRHRVHQRAAGPDLSAGQRLASVEAAQSSPSEAAFAAQRRPGRGNPQHRRQARCAGFTDRFVGGPRARRTSSAGWLQQSAEAAEKACAAARARYGRRGAAVRPPRQQLRRATRRACARREGRGRACLSALSSVCAASSFRHSVVGQLMCSRMSCGMAGGLENRGRRQRQRNSGECEGEKHPAWIPAAVPRQLDGTQRGSKQALLPSPA